MAWFSGVPATLRALLPASIATGFESLIATAISGSEITPISTSAITSSNAVTQVDAFVDGLPVWMLKKGVQILLLLREYLWTTARTTAHWTPTASKKEPNGFYNLDGFNNITLVPVSWLPKTSDRLIATVAGNMIFGTDSETKCRCTLPWAATLWTCVWCSLWASRLLTLLHYL